MKDFCQNEIKISKIKNILFISFFKYIILIIIFIIIIYLTIFFKVKAITNNSHYIFTFWEPHSSINGYISLCIKTWKKNFPSNYKIVILDYSNLSDYLDIKLINRILYKHMDLPVQADAIRVAMLYKYGGFWMDADTLIINSKFIDLIHGSDLIMFGNSKDNHKQHIGFIYASSHSTVLKAWLNIIIYKVKIYKYRLLLYRIFNTKFFKNLHDQTRIWSYLGNGILDNLVKNISEKEFKRIERDDILALPDQTLLKGPINKRYIKFYFSSVEKMPNLNKSKGVLLLHNSWTPKKYKRMSEVQFLSQDIVLARLISNVLYNR